MRNSVLIPNRKDAVGDATETAHPSGSRDPATLPDGAPQTDSTLEAQARAQSGAQAGASTLQQRASDRIPDERKDQAREYKDATKQRTKNYLASKMPEERRDQTIWRLKKLVIECQGHPDCK